MKFFSKPIEPAPEQQPLEDLEARSAIQALEQRITLLEQHIAALEEKLEQQVAHPVAAIEQPPVIDDKKPPVEKGPRQLYLSTPTPDGVFTEFSDDERVGSSVYLLTTDDGINGTFRLLNTPDALATATISISQFVKPVCKIIGQVNIQPRHVVVHMPGSAVFEDGVWRTTVKAQVQFE